MYRTAALALAVGVANAQQSVLTLPFYGYDTQSIEASVVGVSGQTTTLALNCPSGTEGGDECGLAPIETMTLGAGRSNYNIYMSDGGFVMTQDCSIAGTTSAVCKESASGASANDPGSSTVTYGPTDVVAIPVTITAGADKLGAAATGAAGSTTGTATETSSASLTMLSGTASGTSSQGASASSGSKTGSAPAATSSGSGSALVVGQGSLLAAVAGMGYLCL